MQNIHFKTVVFIIIFILFLPTHGKAALSGERASALLIADDYIRNVRKWEPDSYYLRIIGRPENAIFLLGAYKLEDREALDKRMKEIDGVINTFFPSEFRMVVDIDKEAVVEDIRPFDKDRHPRP